MWRRSILNSAFWSLFITVMSLLVLAPTIIHAQCAPGAAGFVPLACAEKAPLLQSAYQSGSLTEYINSLFRIAISAGAIMAVLRIAYGGYLYMGSADMWGSKQQAKSIIGNAIVGLLILLGVYIILALINPEIVKVDVLKNFNPYTPPTKP